MKRLLYVLLATACVLIGQSWSPAEATPNAGPWDAYATFWKDTTTTLSVRIRVSVDSDDEVSARYKACYTVNENGSLSYSGNTLDATSGTLDTSSTNGLVSKEAIPSRGVANVTVTVSDVKIVLFATACTSSTVGLPIRGRGNVTTVPSGQVTQTNTTPPQPLASGVNPVPAVPPFTVTDCSRSLYQDGSTRYATFRSGTVTPLTGTTDTYSWDFGDSTTPATTATAQHTYTATMPSGGWTATLTVTRTGNGTTYTSDPVTATCALRVDWLNPNSTTPTTTTPDEEDSDCPTGFGWLNPLAIIKTLKCLFIPSEDAVNSLGNLWGDMTTKAPFSWAYEVVTFPGEIFQAIHDSAEDAREAEGGGNACADLLPGVGDDTPTGNTSSCYAEAQYGSVFTVFRTVFWYLFLLGTALGIWHAITWAVS
jgi:hypothetical protein